MDGKDNNVFKKLIATLNRYKEDIIITTDDDVLYPYDMIETALKEYKSNKEKNPMSFGGYQTDWVINKTKIHSHYGALTIVKYIFFNEKLNELYNETYDNAVKNGIKAYDDLLYTYAALINGYLYKRGKYSVRSYTFNSPQLSNPFSDRNSKQNWERILIYHDYIRNYIFDKYNLTAEQLIKKSI